MTNSYFRNIPDFDYVNRSDSNRSDGDYVKVKNFFKKGKLREDIFQDLTFFTKFTIQGDDRPDNVAQKLYGNSELDWIVLISNNIINVRDEWPMAQYDLERYLDNKYSAEQLSEIHHYETKEVRTHPSMLLLEKGLHVDASFKFRYSDINGHPQELSGSDIVTSVSYYQYEVAKNDEKRKIYTLRPNYLDIVFSDMREIMTYTNSSQYIDNRTKKGDNLRLLSPR